MIGQTVTTPRLDGAEIGRAAPASRLPSTLRALGHRNYRLFFAGQLDDHYETFRDRVDKGVAYE